MGLTFIDLSRKEKNETKYFFRNRDRGLILQSENILPNN